MIPTQKNIAKLHITLGDVLVPYLPIWKTPIERKWTSEVTARLPDIR